LSGASRPIGLSGRGFNTHKNTAIQQSGCTSHGRIPDEGERVGDAGDDMESFLSFVESLFVILSAFVKSTFHLIVPA
jgi:hypothetical protein